ncbi:PAAR domain-containing protein [Tenacibaculum maritimum]|uniref:PAAR domain-containing protein n=2 Tax=Tenacibaculum maritimum TaxID=107401 RepID=UPI0010A4996D|nr:PAAR domain-containing protein [Tenacibaculum maritimum]MCD9582935.1 PAAR domain-containing protein [Tenacibaculum maritimum]MCD9610452.1 PAAR domain-containing protein [Tenacibaculum maritimum]MCD9635987.1 PAAR domain-containing protein [Tenacibaculum maritimum]QCD62679.1 hypothetical protein B9C57_09155 [Tenacibaculum maritimum]CAA0148408.1 conserved hypothetical protein [Tenacibaculum maritimum]
MEGKPAAIVGSNHICPMCSGTIPHVGGPVIQGESNVLFNDKPVATMGSLCTCVGSSDTIVQGNPTVLINGKPIACVGDMTAHGGVVVSGSSNIIIGSKGASPTTIMPIKEIPFPKITFANRILGNANKAIANQKKIRQKTENIEGDKRVYNLRWIKEEKIIKKSKVLRKVTLRASTVNFAEGETVTLTVSRHKKEMDEEGTRNIVNTVLEEVTGVVHDKKVDVIWEIEEDDNEVI